ncbi:glycosyltransferase [Paenibacillus mesotrionivorans]|uniref:Glycosyltransferase n=1 Tax=Paenibacillus mesotrionivorans TaxID=3160968 RepID=A0ACC7NZB9_9BACL
MKTLYITDFYYFVDSGAKVLARAHLNTLNEIFDQKDVVVIALPGANAPEKTVEGHITITGYKNSIALYLGCLLGYSTYLNEHGMRRIISIIEVEKIEFVFIDNSIFGKLVKKIKKRFPHIIVASFYHDVKASLAAAWKKESRLYKKPIYQAMIQNEKLTAQYCDINFTLNRRESELFEKFYKKKPEVELSVYMDIPKPSKQTKNIQEHEKLKLLFFGGAYLPNKRGIDWFVKNVMPRLGADVELTIAGRGMEQLQKNNYPDNVIVLGRVESPSTLYEEADVVLSPIFEGGGMKVKVAESMAYGKIIIASNESYEGYNENIPVEYWDKYFYKANVADEYVNIINKLVTSKQEIFRYNPQVRSIFEEFYSSSYAQLAISLAIKNYINGGKMH